MIAKIGSWLLILPSVILGILIVELLCRLFLPLGVVHDVRHRLQRVVFLDGRPPIFRNEGDIFTYLPHNDIATSPDFSRITASRSNMTTASGPIISALSRTTISHPNARRCCCWVTHSLKGKEPNLGSAK
jgi:hypothetical protein